MSDHETIPPETDDEIRLRLQAFAQEVTEGVDTEAALRHLPRRSRPPHLGLLTIAACMVAIVALAAVVAADRQSVDTTDLSDSPTPSTDCPATTPRAITQGAQMKHRFAAPVASAATAILLLGACSEDGPTTLAQGTDVELVDGVTPLRPGESGFAGQTLNIMAEEANGDVTGEVRFTDPGGEVTVAVECADTDTDDVVILGGTVTESSDNGISGMVVLFIREGDPDRVALWLGSGENQSCEELLENRRDVLDDENAFLDVEAGSNIETG